MAHCGHCGATVPDDGQFCPACGGKLSAATSTAPAQPEASFASPDPALPWQTGAPDQDTGQAASLAQGSKAPSATWQDVTEPSGSLTLTMTVTCDHCAGRVPINGPTTSPLCPHCQKTSTLRRLSVELTYAAEGSMLFGSPYKYRTYEDPSPHCAVCDAPVPITAYLKKVGATTTIPCPSCGAGLATFPAPAWLKKDIPGALQVFGADPEVATAEADLALHLDNAASEPIVMSCPKCQGALTITESTERTTACSYCQSNIFLPDDLWKRLHPVKIQQRWTLTYLGTSLKTAKQIKKAKEKAAKKITHDAKRAKQKKKYEKQAKRSSLITKLSAGGGVIVPLIIGAVFLFKGGGCSSAEGRFTARGKPLGNFVLTPTECRSGQRQNFYGVVLIPGKKSTGAHGAIKLVKDPVKGWLVQVQLPGSCKAGRCRAVTFNRGECKKGYDISVRRTNTTVNNVRLLKGHLRLNCNFKGPKGGGTARAQITFSGCGG